MYTVPANVNVQAKKLIENFEKGEVIREEKAEEEPKSNYPQMYAKELAQPGTARKRMVELERLKKEAEAREKAVGRAAPLTRKLSEEMFGDFAQDRMKKGGSEASRVAVKNGADEPREEERPAVEERVEEVVLHEGSSDREGSDRRGRTRVLIVTTGGGIASALDKGLVENVVRILKDAEHEVYVTELNHSRV